MRGGGLDPGLEAEVGITPLEPTHQALVSPSGGYMCRSKAPASSCPHAAPHRVLLIRQQTMLANAFRAHLAELGIAVVQGIRHVRELIEKVFAEDIFDLPALVRTALRPLVAQLMELRLQIKSIEKELLAGIGQARKASGWKRSPEWGLLRRRWNRLSSERINQEM